jgi:phage FluMu protein Com
MGDAVYVQCQWCGKLHKVETVVMSEDDIYIELHCPRCKDDTNHLLIGEYKDDVYTNGNANLDERIYKYNTK